MRKILTICFVLALISAAHAGVNERPFKYGIVVSEETSRLWGDVVSALQQKYGDNKVFVWKGDVFDVREDLARYFPKYVCFVARPDEMTKPEGMGSTPNPFVLKVHDLTRSLDSDPYGDVIWGILTGYEKEDALRIARNNTPLEVKNALGLLNGGFLKWFKEGISYSEVVDNHYFVKNSGTKGNVVEKSDGPLDTVGRFVDYLNNKRPDFILTSSHSTESDFSGFRHNKETGRIVPNDGRLTGVDMSGKEYPINSLNSKIYSASGNCLIGNITGRNCMALAWMHSGGVNQMMGYTVTTWYGYQGHVTLNNFISLGGAFTFAESFYLANQMLLFDLEKNLVAGQDVEGHNYDKDSVAFYGDPAWQARMYKDKSAPAPAWEASLKETGRTGDKRTFQLTIKFNRDVDFSNNRNHILAFTPGQLVKPEIVNSGGARAAEVTENFIIVTYDGIVKAGAVKSVEFKASI